MKRILGLIAALTVFTATAAFAAFPASPTVTTAAKVSIAKGHIKVGADSFYMVLKYNSTDDATATSYSTTNELTTASGYTAGGVLLTGCAATASGTQANITCSAASWTPTGAFTFNQVEIYDASSSTNGSATTNEVIGLWPVTSTTTTSGTPLTVTIPANGLNIQ